MSNHPDPIHFNPPEHAIDALLAALIDPTQSLAHIAAAKDTTADALALWLARPAIAQRLRRHESAHAARLRLTATARLSHALQAVTRILTDFNAHATPPAPAHPAPSPAPAGEVASRTLAALERGENGGGSPTPEKSDTRSSTGTPSLTSALIACRATSLLLRLARYYPAPAPHARESALHVSTPKPAVQTSYYDEPAPAQPAAPAHPATAHGHVAVSPHAPEANDPPSPLPPPAAPPPPPTPTPPAGPAPPPPPSPPIRPPIPTSTSITNSISTSKTTSTPTSTPISTANSATSPNSSPACKPSPPPTRPKTRAAKQRRTALPAQS